MNIWNRVRSALPGWWPARTSAKRKAVPDVERHWLAAHHNLRALLEDTRVPAGIRAELGHEFEQLQRMADKLEGEEIHIAAFGRVGVGKSSLLNALLGQARFRTSALHGETRTEARARWQAPGDATVDGHVVLIDTPGIDELGGDERERLAHAVSRRADIVLMVCESDLTRLEHDVLRRLAAGGRRVLLVLNKADRFEPGERAQLLERLRKRTNGWLPADRIVAASANPQRETVVTQLADGTEREELRDRRPEVTELRERLWDLLEHEGKALAALNASLFASELDTRVAERIVQVRRNLAERLIRRYCLVKGLLVAVNPVPVADLLAAAGTDVAMVVQLGRLYGFRMRRNEASRLLLTISAQLVALMGGYWGLNLVSSALKTASVGLSTALTATAQGALAWYATFVIGRMAQTWFARGKSWGPEGPKEVARALLASLDREALLREARAELAARLDRQTG